MAYPRKSWSILFKEANSQFTHVKTLQVGSTQIDSDRFGWSRIMEKKHKIENGIETFKPTGQTAHDSQW